MASNISYVYALYIKAQWGKKSDSRTSPAYPGFSVWNRLCILMAVGNIKANPFYCLIPPAAIIHLQINDYCYNGPPTLYGCIWAVPSSVCRKSLSQTAKLCSLLIITKYRVSLFRYLFAEYLSEASKISQPFVQDMAAVAADATLGKCFGLWGLWCALI